MAEVLGVVASGIAVVQIASQLGSSILTLKRLWNDIQDIPDTINHLMSQIEHLDMILTQSENEFNQVGSIVEHDSSARLSTEYCKKAKDDLAFLIGELSAQINNARRPKRGIAKMKVVLKKDLLKKYETRLSSAVQLLNLSQQSYMMSLMRQQPALIMAQLTSSSLIHHPQLAPSVEETSDGKAELCESEKDLLIARSTTLYPLGDAHARERPQHKPKNSASKQPPSLPWRYPASFLGGFAFRSTSNYNSVEGGSAMTLFQARIQVPIWLARSTVEFQMLKSMAGWQITFRTYNIISWDSLLIEYARSGKTAELLALFSKRQVSILDRSTNGFTLALYAILCGKFDTWKTLVEIGLPLSEMDGFDQKLLAKALNLRDRESALQLSKSYYCMSVLQFLRSQGTFDRYYLEAPPEILDDYFLLSLPSSCARDDGFWNLLSSYLGDRDMLVVVLNEIWPKFSNMPHSHRLGVITNCMFTAFEWAYPAMDARAVEWLFNQDLDGTLEVKFLRLALSKYPIILDVFIRQYMGFVYLQLVGSSGDICSDWRAMMPRIACAVGLEGMRDKRRPGCSVLTRWLTDFISGRLLCFSLTCTNYDVEKIAIKLLRIWMEDVKKGGIELEKFGKGEKELLTRHSKLDWDESGPALASFTYGPDPEDWIVLWDWKIEVFAGEFWEIVESPNILLNSHVPGAWVEEDDC